MDESLIIRALLSLGAMAALLGGIVYLLKKMNRRGSKAESKIPLHVINRLALSPKSQVYLIKAGNRTLLLGSSDHSVNFIADLSDEDMQKIKTGELQSNSSRRESLEGKFTQADLKPLPKPVPLDEDTSFRNYIKSTFKKTAN